MTATPIFQLQGISKTFPGVKALDNVELALYPGEVTALMGENGAGKSTLVKIMTGIYQPDSGHIEIGGQATTIANAREAHALGITAIHQETVLFDDLTVVENLFVGQYLYKGFGIVLDWQTMTRRTIEILEILGVSLNPHELLSHLSIAQKHMVSIARALAFDAKIVILDEPTAALSHREIDELYELIERLKAQGKAILFISHKLDEVFRIADRYHIFRDGQHIKQGLIRDIDQAQMVTNMVGRSVDQVYPKQTVALGEVVLEVDKLSLEQEFADISFNVRRGEIIGFYGLIGSGRTEVMQAIFGASGQPNGTISVLGETVTIRTPAQAIDLGIVYVPEERQAQGTVLEFSIAKNISLPQLGNVSRFGFIQPEKEWILADQYANRLQVKASGWDQEVGNLSGGNQQKVVIGKWLARAPKIIILDEPTKGIDIGSKAAVHEFIGELVAQGLAVIMVTSELSELLGLADRMYVMAEGRMQGEFSRADASAEKIIKTAIGS